MFFLENLAFVPRIFASGLTLRNGEKLFQLSRDDPIEEEIFDLDTHVSIVGNITEVSNKYLPGRFDGDIAVMNVGLPNYKQLIAVARHEETLIKGKLDFITVPLIIEYFILFYVNNNFRYTRM